jgi:hypothetical protein
MFVFAIPSPSKGEGQGGGVAATADERMDEATTPSAPFAIGGGHTPIPTLPPSRGKETIQ